ncbi:23399_t:CDS:2, partial [Gigaspora margarita]
NEIALRSLVAKKRDWFINKRGIIDKVPSINSKIIKIYYWKVVEEGNRIKSYERYKQKNTKEEKCIIKTNTETENYKKRAGMSKTEERIYILRICRNYELIDQGVTNKKRRKILNAIMNEMDKRRDQKAEFWVKISRSSKEKTRDIQSI